MTDDQLKKEFGKIKMSVSIHVQAKRVEKCVEIAKRYAEPEWIPINSPEEVKGITDSAFVTYKTANGVRYVIEVAHLEHIYLYTYIKDKPIAYMIKEYPKSYRP